jgi:hypothetical protein
MVTPIIKSLVGVLSKAVDKIEVDINELMSHEGYVASKATFAGWKTSADGAEASMVKLPEDVRALVEPSITRLKAALARVKVES